MKIDYEKELNESQYKTMKHLDNIIRLDCVPGSGKTRVLTYKLHYMIRELRIKPENILVATFTKQAAKEMKERLSKLLDKDEISDLYIGTFHSLGYKILKHEYMLLDDPMQNFKLLDGPPIKWLLKEILNELKIETNDKYNESTFEYEINKLKMELKAPESLILDFLLDVPTREQKDLLKVYEMYEQKKQEKKVIDYNDMLYQLYNLFIKYRDVLKKYQNRFQYIMVDEAQDNNYAQYELINILKEVHNNVFIIGDVDQSIYKFRGAKPEQFIDFNNEDLISINLEENYRSLPFITSAANNLIKNNKIRLEKTINPFRENTDDKIILTNHRNEEEEANDIALKVKQLIDDGFKYNDIAILYRVNAQSGAIEESLMMNSIPFISSNMLFYERSEIKDIIAYLKLAHNTLDNSSFLRIYNKPSRYLGKVFMESIERESRNRRISYYEALEYVDAPYKNKPTVTEFKRTIKHIKEEIKNCNDIGEVVKFIRNVTNYDSYMMKDSIDNEDNTKLDNLNTLVIQASRYKDISDFLNHVDKILNNKNENGVKLSTIHQSKGLEFKAVFIVGASNGLLPHSHSLRSGEDAIEEERRLMYVAITRAQDKLFISSIDNFQDKKLSPSIFLDEI